MSEISHVTTFQLDTWFADGKPDGAVAAHVATCPRCAAYVAELDGIAEELVVPAPPARVPGPTATPLTRVSVLRRFGPILGGLALAAGLALFVRSRVPIGAIDAPLRTQGDDPTYVAEKGGPSVQLLVRSDGVTRVWDGASPVRAGDAIAIHVACDRLTHVAIVTETSSGLTRLSEGPCPARPAPLPFTLVVDDEVGRERFAVVLTRGRADDAALRAMIASQAREADAWATTFDFPKAPRR